MKEILVYSASLYNNKIQNDNATAAASGTNKATKIQMKDLLIKNS